MHVCVCPSDSVGLLVKVPRYVSCLILVLGPIGTCILQVGSVGSPFVLFTFSRHVTTGMRLLEVAFLMSRADQWTDCLLGAAGCLQYGSCPFGELAESFLLLCFRDRVRIPFADAWTWRSVNLCRGGRRDHFVPHLHSPFFGRRRTEDASSRNSSLFNSYLSCK